MTVRSRYEYKFRIPESKAELLACEIRPFMRRDPWLEAHGETSYTVSSLYLDSPSLLCYGAVDQGEKNRFKLRVRWYGDDVCDPVFLEEKRRKNEAIFKTRVTVTSEGTRRLLRGLSLKTGDIVSRKTGDRAEGEELLRKARTLLAKPACVVRYQREAWEDRHDKGLRVTFDRALHACPASDNTGTRTSTPVEDRGTILEIKFHNQVPQWLASLVRRHELFRESIPKYVLCVDALRSSFETGSLLSRTTVANGKGGT